MMSFTNAILIQNWFIFSILNPWGVVSFTTVIFSGTTPTLDVIEAFFIFLAKLFNYKSTSKLEALPDELLLHIGEFVGVDSCYLGYGAVCKTTNTLFKTYPYSKFLSMSTSYGGYAPLQEILQKCEIELEKGEEYYYRKIPEIIHQLASGAVSFNRTDLLIWMIETRNKHVFQAICERGIKDRKLSIFQNVWNISIEDENVETHMIQQTRFIEVAAEKGYLNWLIYLREKLGCEWDSFACSGAAGGGNLDCLKYLHEQGCRWDKFACIAAAENGHLKCLKYLHNHGCEWDSFACFYAARGGHLDCLMYLHENDCEWNKWACRAAVNGKHLDCLQYMRDNGLEWDRYDIYLDSISQSSDS